MYFVIGVGVHSFHWFHTSRHQVIECSGRQELRPCKARRQLPCTASILFSLSMIVLCTDFGHAKKLVDVGPNEDEAIPVDHDACHMMTSQRGTVQVCYC